MTDRPIPTIANPFDEFKAVVDALHHATDNANPFDEALDCLDDPAHNHFYDASLTVHLYNLQSRIEDGLAHLFGMPLLAFDVEEEANDGDDDEPLDGGSFDTVPPEGC